jgi:hypothetical protein
LLELPHGRAGDSEQHLHGLALPAALAQFAARAGCLGVEGLAVAHKVQVDVVAVRAALAFLLHVRFERRRPGGRTPTRAVVYFHQHLQKSHKLMEICDNSAILFFCCP